MLTLDTGRLPATARFLPASYHPVDVWELLNHLHDKGAWTAAGAHVTVTPLFIAGPNGVGDDTDLYVMVGPVDGATVVVNLSQMLCVADRTASEDQLQLAHRLCGLISAAVEGQLNAVRSNTPFGLRLVPVAAVRAEAADDPYLDEDERAALEAASDRDILDAIDRAAGGSAEDQLYHLHDQIQADAVHTLVAAAREDRDD